MTKDELAEMVVSKLQAVAPGCDPQSVDPDADLRDELDIDSMDFLNFIIAMHEALNVDVPEADYPKLATLNGTVSYFHMKLSGEA